MVFDIIDSENIKVVQHMVCSIGITLDIVEELHEMLILKRIMVFIIKLKNLILETNKI